MIDHLNNVQSAMQWIAEYHVDIALSVVSRTEVLTGYATPQRMVIRNFLDRFPSLVVDEQTADIAADLRRQYRWKLPDAFQAALAVQHNLVLVTRNTKDFSPEQHNFVMVPYQLS